MKLFCQESSKDGDLSLEKTRTAASGRGMGLRDDGNEVLIWKANDRPVGAPFKFNTFLLSR
nr:CNT_HP1_G0007150.mRNA.1.CDS.1 [Saccharomyces cerevisiae]